jgi:hypothetical protein
MLSSCSAGTFSMILVNDRVWTRQVAELDLWCDDREVPVNLPETYDHWLAGVFMRQSPPADGVADEVTAREPGRQTLDLQGFLSCHNAANQVRRSRMISFSVSATDDDAEAIGPTAGMNATPWRRASFAISSGMLFAVSASAAA